MQIAENIVRNGMAAGTAFMDALTDLVAKYKLTRIIETGTYHGTGTTAAIIKGINSHTLRPVTFVSIEVNPEHYDIAKRNNRGKPVDIILGLSISSKMLPKEKEITFKGYPSQAIVDHQEADRQKRYYAETAYKVDDERLSTALLLTSYYPQLVVLDSAGHIGTLEFDYLMERVKGSFYLALDDTNHVKHIKTVQKIKKDKRFTEWFSTDEKFGSKIYKFNETENSQG